MLKFTNYRAVNARYSLDFTLDSWLQANGISDVGAALTSVVSEQLMQELGVDKFLKKTPCIVSLMQWKSCEYHHYILLKMAFTNL